VIFSIPQIVLFCFVGSAGRATLLDSSNALSSLLSLVLAVALITLISWRVRRMLRNPCLRRADRNALI
jgi:flagellar biogenesis protein FliO